MSNATASVPGSIDPACVYHVDEFLRRVRWSKHAWRTAKRRGLNVIHTAGRAYVRGSDFVSYLDGIDASDGDA